MKVQVKLIKNHGSKKAGEMIECHPNMIPILKRRGIIEDEKKAAVIEPVELSVETPISISVVPDVAVAVEKPKKRKKSK
jgi:hypothetical protein